MSSYQSRILPVSVEIAQEWGRLNASSQPPPIIDGLMAATANVHRLTLVTRNIADVARTGVAVINPFEKQ
jgi:predicted nucleic acid-binding protein